MGGSCLGTHVRIKKNNKGKKNRNLKKKKISWLQSPFAVICTHIYTLLRASQEELMVRNLPANLDEVSISGSR